jgi:hypothetical protein
MVEIMTMNDRDIRICDNKGFHLDLPNGVTVSVQLGPGSYCDSDVSNADFNAPLNVIGTDETWGSNTAECAAYVTGSNLAWIAVPEYTGGGRDRCGGDDVCGYLNVSQVLDFINKASLLNPVANPRSYSNQMTGVLDHGDYRDDPKLLEDERKVMDEIAIDEFFSGLRKFPGSSPADES